MFKKGDLIIGNRLQAVRYDFAGKLKATGADTRIWPTQIGFRTGRGTIRCWYHGPISSKNKYEMHSSNGNELWFSMVFPSIGRKKCEVLPVGCEAYIAAPDGSALKCKTSHIREIIWMPLALVARKFEDD